MNFTYKKTKKGYIYKNVDGFDFELKSTNRLRANDLDSLFLAINKVAKENGGKVEGKVDNIEYRYIIPNPWEEPKKVKVYKKPIHKRIWNFIRKLV